MATGPSNNLPAPSGFPNFQYEPLKSASGKPLIRLAVLQSGARTSSIRMKLVHTAFAALPKYEALSYTWGRPDVVKNIELNGIRVQVRENLWLALVHLRRATEDRVLWIDAICINQADLEERSEQVQIMAYIYSRAEKVSVWLGVIKRFDPKPYKDTKDLEALDIHTLTLQPYWERVWIVQEIGSAMSLEVHWGLTSEPVLDGDGPRKTFRPQAFTSRSESWDQFFSQMKDSHNNALKLAQQRKGRHGDNYLLANLLEVCQRSRCEEPRDKIYGFIGIAHDCQDGKFPVDYNKSLFELYEDAIRFHVRSHIDSTSVVHFSQLVQQLIGGHLLMKQDLARSRPLPSGRKPENVDVVAQYHGTISLVGPSYDDFVAFPEATRQWKSALSGMEPRKEKLVGTSTLEEHTIKKKFLERLRTNNETLFRKLYDLNASSLAKVATIESKIFWDGNPSENNVVLQAPTVIPPLPSEAPLGPWKEKKDERRLFCADNAVLGLMPPHAQLHDVLFKFQKTDIVAIVRPPTSNDSDTERIGFARLVGRALAVSEKSSSDDFDLEESTTMTMDLRLLQLLTE